MTKKNRNKDTGSAFQIGFLPDFSRYLDRYYPIEKIYNDPSFLEKIGNILKAIITMKNPAQELQERGFCKKFEKMSPGQDRDFFNKLTGAYEWGSTVHPYYSSFGSNKYGIAIYLDSNNRHAYFLTLDVEHKIRRYHGKLG